MRAMTRLDVAHGASHRLQVAANTVYKQYRNGQAIWVYCTDPKRLASFSKMLWSIEDTEFVPHHSILEGVGSCLVQLCQEDPSQYLIEWEKGVAEQVQTMNEQANSEVSPASENKSANLTDEQSPASTAKGVVKAKMPLLLNLDLNCPPNFTAFDRILEIVSTHPTDQEYARQRMQQYKQAGLKPAFHKLG